MPLVLLSDIKSIFSYATPYINTPDRNGLRFAALAAKPSDPYAKPDFAFPAKVSANAKEMFDKALATDNGPLALRALMNLSVSLTDIDADSASVVLRNCRKAEKLLSSPSDKALVDLLTAKYTIRYTGMTVDLRSARTAGRAVDRLQTLERHPVARHHNGPHRQRRRPT